VTATLAICGGGGGVVVSVRLGIEKSRIRSPGSAKKVMHVCKYLPVLSCVLCYIMCLIVVSVCTIVNLQH